MSVVIVGRGGTLGAVLADRLAADAIELRVPDPTDMTEVGAIARASVVINAGGPRVRPGLVNADYVREHVGLAARIVRSMRPGAHLIHLSSTAVYGARAKRLGVDDVEAPTLFPYADYAAAKLAAETMVRSLGPERGIHVTVVRPSMVYGPGIDSAVESIRRLAGRGISLRLAPGRLRQHLVHIDLLVDLIAAVAQRKAPSGARIFVAADPFVLTNEDLIAPARLPVVVPLAALAAAKRAIGVAGLSPDILDTFAVLAIDNEFEGGPAFAACGLDPARYARERTFDPYFRAPFAGREDARQ